MATNPNPNPCPKTTLLLQNMEEVKKVFEKFDANGDGKISATEFADVMKALGSKASMEEVSSAMEEIDTDQDGFINLEEFAAFLKGGSSAAAAGCGGEDDGGVGQIRGAFEIFDQDKNGLISPSELQCVMHKLGEKCTVNDCSRMIEAVDSDGDGNVNFDEFKKMMTNRCIDGDTRQLGN